MINFGALFSNGWLQIVAAAIIGYVLGSVNLSIIITNITIKEDIRTMGSGNAGFTNVLRSVGKYPAIITMIGDFLKTIAAVFLGGYLFSTISDGGNPEQIIVIGKLFTGLFCIIGHVFPCYFGFKGGKGVVCACGTVFAADFRIFLMLVAVFLIVFIFSRIISLSSLSAAAAFPIITFCVVYFLDADRFTNDAGEFITYTVVLTAISAVMSILVIAKHSSNIKRILNGTEKKIFVKK